MLRFSVFVRYPSAVPTCVEKRTGVFGILGARIACIVLGTAFELEVTLVGFGVIHLALSTALTRSLGNPQIEHGALSR
jgi:hypothetical protein